MPKEYIHNRYYGQTARSHEGCDTKGEFHCPPDCTGSSLAPLDDSAVKVGWTKDLAHVEIAIVSGGHKENPDADAWHTQFDRDGINRLIRSLRKARDAAFGSDA